MSLAKLQRFIQYLRGQDVMKQEDVLRAVEGERIVGLEPVMGYMHRNHEKIGERNAWIMNFPYTDRLDYLTSMGNNFGYAVAVEQLTGVKVPERDEYIRVIMAELQRIASHLIAVGTFGIGTEPI